MQERAASTRQAVLEGAAASFDKFGYGTASLSTIIAHAGVSKGAMYFHFSSKEELAQAVIDAQLALATAATVTIIEQTPKAFDALILITKELARQLQTESIARGGMRLTLESTTAQNPNARSFDDWIEMIATLTGRAQSEGDVVDDVDVVALARLIVASFTGVQTVSEMLTGRADLQLRMTEMWHLLLPSVVPRRRLPRVRAVVDGPLIDWNVH
ncbi:ScbR family autoregulator-binding transcription factor [Rhodococcus sp. IEGM 1381]|uniref:ScbR family autoregulator-binding transcription factor n=1 Tax=Rhodococcus sp. IEGM 1381 TaxID=3047085 RepID=UPI0024B71CC3|nr:ScbR family autoregulator-binding transcription factor [Rhodococcus sp. IEGM 1381]MDI9895507.1 ScbR family autoregulator-binding transcription factor [Rhodococcus sp. IEGM 1381]